MLPCPYQSKSLTILAVDDEESVLHVVAAMLQEDGHRVVTATSGKAALALMRTVRWNVLVTDRCMPQMPGEKFAHEAKVLSPHTAIVMLTGHAPTHVPLSVDALITKPFTYSSLSGGINRALRCRVGASGLQVQGAG